MKGSKLTKEEIEFITDDTCKYGHLTGWSTPNNCHQCIDCGKLFPEDNERKGIISESTYTPLIK